MKNVITTAHGTGGRSQFELIEKIFKPHFKNPLLSEHDAAAFQTESTQSLVTTDLHVVEPIIFPGGDIGKLSVCGVINDLLTRGGKPQYMSLGFILEEGLTFETLERIVKSTADVMNEHDIRLLCADTKVIGARSEKPGLMISSTLFGVKVRNELQLDGPQPGDAVLLTNSIGNHGLAILQAREELSFKNVFSSDCKPLYKMIAPIILSTNDIKYMRDPTRGGVAAVLHELAEQFKVGFEIDELSIPIEKDVKIGLNLLGLDPLETANEGVMLMIVRRDQAENLVRQIRQHPDGKQAAVIGRVTPLSTSKLVLNTSVGGRRRVPWPEALNLPRIC